jgi:F420-0:gamma-glutamyl ligase
MSRLPEYVGPVAVGLKMGVILPGMSIVEEVFQRLAACHRDGLLHDGDIIAITESVVARAQNNYVTTADIAAEVRRKLGLPEQGRVAVVYPIASRNRFSLILKGIAEAASGGEVLVQLSFPHDEVGNQVICPDFARDLDKDLITDTDLSGHDFKHPITGVNYLNLYRDVIMKAGAKPFIFLCNDPRRVAEFNPHGVIAADIHTRASTKAAVRQVFENCVTLDELCNEGTAYSEWGLLGSNMSAGDRLKLAPREGRQIVLQMQRRLADAFGLKVEVLIYGDGAYRDPSSGIYELADPRPAFAVTDGLNCFREGLKLKYLADHYYHEHGKTAAEIEAILAESKKRAMPDDCIEREGTTPRRLEDVLASLADLVSGSADAGTPVVLIKGF